MIPSAILRNEIGDKCDKLLDKQAFLCPHVLPINCDCQKLRRYDRKGYAEDSDEDDDEYEFEDAQNLFDVIAEMFMQR